MPMWWLRSPATSVSRTRTASRRSWRKRSGGQFPKCMRSWHARPHESPSMRPGRAEDLPALVKLWRSEGRGGRRDSLPREGELQKLLAHFAWDSRSRLVENGAAGLAGAVVVTSRKHPEGTVARIDPATAG